MSANWLETRFNTANGMVNSVYSKYSLVVHKDAERELDSLWDLDEAAAADITILLETLQESQDLLDRLSSHGFVQYQEPAIDISKWISQQRSQKRNLWRLKLVAFANSGTYAYRVIYAFHPTEHRYYVLGILKRDFDYDPEHPTSKRIIAAYEQLGIPDY